MCAVNFIFTFMKEKSTVSNSYKIQRSLICLKELTQGIQFSKTQKRQFSGFHNFLVLSYHWRFPLIYFQNIA